MKICNVYTKYESAEKIAHTFVNGNGKFPSISEDNIDEVSWKNHTVLRTEKREQRIEPKN